MQKQRNEVMLPVEQKQHYIDVLTAMFHVRIAKKHIAMLEFDPELKSAAQDATTELSNLEAVAEYVVPNTRNQQWLEKELDSSKMDDLAILTEMIAKISDEEPDDTYQEFFGILVSFLDEVLYSKQHRKKLHFGKWKYIFRTMIEELRFDINRQKGRFWYRKDGVTQEEELYMRTVVPQTITKIKE